MSIHYEEIGRGAYGKVYKFKDTDGTSKALKSIEWKKLNYLETDILLNLDSPHILRSYRIQKNGFVMDLFKGDLDSIYQDLTPKEYLSVFFQVFDGLYCLHKNNILHLDIKPDNILYTRDKHNKIRCVISDFGLSVKTEDAFKKKHFTYLGGTKDFEAPEIDTHNIDSRTDVWSFFITFYYMITGKTTIKKINYEDKLEVKKNFFYDKLISYNNNFFEEDRMSFNDISNLSRIMGWMYSIEKDRPNTRDLYSDHYFQKKYKEEKCLMHKSKVYYVPFINHFTFDGIRNIEDLCINERLETYFFCVEIFLAMESIEHKLYNYEEELERVKIAFDLARGYVHEIKYQNFKLKRDDIIFTAVNLSDRMYGSRFMKEAKYLEDLIYLKKYINESENLIHIYNLIEPKKIFELFRETYRYGGGGRKINKKMKIFELNEYKVDIKKEINFIKLNKGYKEKVKSEITEYTKRHYDDLLEDFVELEITLKKLLYNKKINIAITENNNKGYIDEISFDDFIDLCKLFKIKINFINEYKLDNIIDYRDLNMSLKNGIHYLKKDNILIIKYNSKVVYLSEYIIKYKSLTYYNFEDHIFERMFIVCYMVNLHKKFYDIFLEYNDILITLLCLYVHK